MLIFFGRWVSGERLRKATSRDYRYHFGVFALFPVMLSALVILPAGRNIMDHGSAVAVWVYLVAAMLAMFGITILWAKWIPAGVSFVLGICVWAAAFWFAWHKF
jgi:hypothetical protein